MIALVSAINLCYGPSGKFLQKDLNFEVEAGELLVISGSNGCGKSTLLRVILNQIEPSMGKLNCKVPARQVGFLPQMENTEVHLPFTLGEILKSGEGKRWNKETILKLGLLEESQFNIDWNTASGGERKRTLLTRLLLRQPHLLLLDEPMNHLDPTSRQVMLKTLTTFLRSSSEKTPRAAIMVCHQGLLEQSKGAFNFPLNSLKMRTLDLDTQRQRGDRQCI